MTVQPAPLLAGPNRLEMRDAEVSVGQPPGVIRLSRHPLAAAKVGERKERRPMLPRLPLGTDGSHRRVNGSSV